MYFNYKTTKEFVYKKKKYDGGGSKVIEKNIRNRMLLLYIF